MFLGNIRILFLKVIGKCEKFNIISFFNNVFNYIT